MSPLPFALLLVAAAAWYHFGFSGFSIHGSVVDADSGRAIEGARIWSSRSNAISAADGLFTLMRLKPPEAIGVDAPGYHSLSLRVSNPFVAISARLDPVSVDFEPVDADTGLPVPATMDGPGLAGDPGHLHVAPVRDGQTFVISAPGYQPAQVRYAGQDRVRVPLQARLDGHIADGVTGRPVVDARVSVDGATLHSGPDGMFVLQSRPIAGSMDVLAPGYRRARLDLTRRGPLDVVLEPNPVRATYMTYFAVGESQYRQGLLDLLDSTEINAVVLDIKGDYGLLSYRSGVAIADQIGANAEPTIDDLGSLLETLHAHGAYVIGRIVVFKDNVLARNGSRAGLDLGVKDRRTGSLWVDGENLAWVDPFQPAAWDYNTALAREAIQRGFDEVQFDYIRFPTDPSPDSSVDDIQYSKAATEESRVSALASFLRQAHAAVSDAGGFLSMDTFGYTTWWDNDGGIGQDLEVLADDIDYYCPMVYPSTFNAGLPGGIPYPEVVSRPYDVVFQSLQHARQKLGGKHAVLRPWLQYFDDYPWATRTRYDAAQIEAQKQAAADAHALGWMLWNAGSLFNRGGISPK